MTAALEIATGKVVAHVRNRRTSVNFLRFMNQVVNAFAACGAATSHRNTRAPCWGTSDRDPAPLGRNLETSIERAHFAENTKLIESLGSD